MGDDVGDGAARQLHGKASDTTGGAGHEHPSANN
jgi:hypothetical protein